MLVVTLFLSHLLRDLPQPVLAAVVLVAVAGLFQLSALKHLWHASRGEFVVAMATILGVLGSGLLRGVMIGAIISLVQLLRRASRPHVALLGRIPGTRHFSDRERHPDNELIPGVLIFRPEASLVYFNVDHVCDAIEDRVRAEAMPPRLVVLDLSAAAYVDLQSAHSLAGLADKLNGAGIPVRARGRTGVFERRHKQARFRDPDRTLDRFDFDFNKKMNRALIHELATGRFIQQREDALFLGPPGTGKSHLAQALGYAAIQQGYRVWYREAHGLLEDLADATLVRYRD